MVSLFMVSCDDESALNTFGDAKVCMGESTFKVKESKGLFLVPISVVGERNGAVEVDVEVKSNDPACQEDVHYMVTSKHIIIPHDKSVGYVEIKSVDDHEINPDRSFTIQIVGVRGAQLAEEATSTLVTLLDNDDIPYERMAGTWIVTATDMLQEEGPMQISWEARIQTVDDESEDGYGSMLTMKPWRMWNGETYEGQLDILHDLIFHYNASSQTATVDLKLGQIMAEDFALGGEDEDGLDLTSCTLRSATASLTGYTTMGNVVGKVNEDFSQITFNLPIMGVLYDARNIPFSQWFYYTDIVMTKK